MPEVAQEVPHKACTKCGRDQPLQEFKRHKQTADGRQSQCRSCDNERSLAYSRALWELRNRHYEEFVELLKMQKLGRRG